MTTVLVVTSVKWSFSVKGGNTCAVRFHNMGLNSRNAVYLPPNQAAAPLAGKYPAEITSAPRWQAERIYLYG